MCACAKENCCNTVAALGTIIYKYDLNLYLSDYKNKYGYKALGEDLEHGDIMQKAYVDFYNASKEILLSEEDYELSESTTDGITTKFINVFESEDLEDVNILDYYKSAWSVFISENPIFYFLSNGYLARTKTSTEIRKYSAGEIIELDVVAGLLLQSLHEVGECEPSLLQLLAGNPSRECNGLEVDTAYDV